MSSTQLDLKLLTKRSDVVSLCVVVFHIAVVLAPIYVIVYWGTGWYVIACWAWCGLGMNGLLNLMHECAHLHVFSKRRWSERLGRYLLAPLVFAAFETYQRRHWEHHRHVGEDGETKDTYLIDIRHGNILKLFVRCLLMVEAARKFFSQAVPTSGTVSKRQWLLRVFACHTLFFLSLMWTSRLVGGLTWDLSARRAAFGYSVYIYSLMSLTVFIAALRAIAEHQQYDDGSTTHGYAALRNFACNPVSRTLMGAYGFAEHFTHHMHPGIPYYQLRDATSLLAAQDPALAPTKDYFRIISEIVRGA